MFLTKQLLQEKILKKKANTDNRNLSLLSTHYIGPDNLRNCNFDLFLYLFQN